MNESGAGTARPYLQSLGPAGVLLAGAGESLAIGQTELVSALADVPQAGHVVLLDDDLRQTDAWARLLARRPWIVHASAGPAEALRRHGLLGRVSTIAPGVSFLIGSSEVDVLPRGPELPGCSLLLDWQGVLLLYPAALPTRRTAGEWWETFRLRRFLLPFPGREAIMAWLPQAPVDPSDAAHLAAAQGAGHMCVETDAQPWRVWTLAAGQRRRVAEGGLLLEEEE